MINRITWYLGSTRMGIWTRPRESKKKECRKVQLWCNYAERSRNLVARGPRYNSMYRKSRDPRDQSFPTRSRTSRMFDSVRHEGCCTAPLRARRNRKIRSEVETERSRSIQRQGGGGVSLIAVPDSRRTGHNCRSSAPWRWMCRTRQSARVSSSSITRCSTTRRKGRTS